METNHEFIEMPNSLLQDQDKFNVQHYEWRKGRMKSKRIVASIIFATAMIVVVAVGLSLIHWHNKPNSLDNINLDNTQGCGENWVTFGDEKCFTILNEAFETFNESVESCAKLAANLPIIQTTEEQDFLSAYLFKTSGKTESFWIGAKFSGDKFSWIDNTNLTYTNWVAKGPKIRPNYCVQMQAEEESVGKWIDEHCGEKNLVVCQKSQLWSPTRVQKTLFQVRQEFRVFYERSNNENVELKRKLSDANQKIEEGNKNIINLKQNLIPIGFIYAQLPNESSPADIWSGMTWTDVSATYAGVFFRVSGSDAATFGQIQEDNAPRLDQVYTSDHSNLKHARRTYKNGEMTIPKSGWSNGIYTGTYGSADDFHLHFKLSTGEVRPRNMAIRIWKRIG